LDIKYEKVKEVGLSLDFKTILLAFALFFYLYSVNFAFLPTYTARIIVGLGLVYVFLVAFQNRFPRFSSELLPVLILFFVYFLWAFLGATLDGFSDPSLVISAALLFFQSFIGAVVFVVAFFNLKYSFRDVILILQITVVVQACFVILYFVSWDFREWTFSNVPIGGNIDPTKNLFRSRGLTHSGGATLALMQAIGLLFTAYLVTNVRYRRGQFFYLILSFGLIFISIFLTGRTGLLMLPAVFLFFFFVTMLKGRLLKNIWFFVLIVPLGGVIGILLLKVAYYQILGGFSTSWGSDGFDQLVSWVVSEFVSDDGKIQSRTADILMDHWFFPMDSKTFFLGSPSTWNVNAIPSDIGIVRLWHGVGLIGMLMFYAIFFVIFLVTWIKQEGLSEKLLVLFLFLFLFFTELKEPFLLKLNINSFLSILFFYTLIRWRRIKEKKEILHS